MPQVYPVVLFAFRHHDTLIGAWNRQIANECLSFRPETDHGANRRFGFRGPVVGLLLAHGSNAVIPKREQVIDMGDKSPKSKNKNEKQGKKAKAKAKKAAHKKQERATPVTTGKK